MPFHSLRLLELGYYLLLLLIQNQELRNQNCMSRNRINLRLFHKGEQGGRTVKVILCQKVHHRWVVVKRQPTLDADAVVEMHITSKKAYARLAVMVPPAK